MPKRSIPKTAVLEPAKAGTPVADMLAEGVRKEVREKTKRYFERNPDQAAVMVKEYKVFHKLLSVESVWKRLDIYDTLLGLLELASPEAKAIWDNEINTPLSKDDLGDTVASRMEQLRNLIPEVVAARRSHDFALECSAEREILDHGLVVSQKIEFLFNYVLDGTGVWNEIKRSETAAAEEEGELEGG